MSLCECHVCKSRHLQRPEKRARSPRAVPSSDLPGHQAGTRCTYIHGSKKATKKKEKNKASRKQRTTKIKLKMIF